MKLKTQAKKPLHLIECQEPGNKLKSNMMHDQVFHNDLLSDSITDSDYVRKLMDCSAIVLIDNG